MKPLGTSIKHLETFNINLNICCIHPVSSHRQHNRASYYQESSIAKDYEIISMANSIANLINISPPRGTTHARLEKAMELNHL